MRFPTVVQNFFKNAGFLRIIRITLTIKVFTMAENDSDQTLNKLQVISTVKRMNKKYGKVATLEIKQRDPFIPIPIEQKIRKEVPSMKVVTANEIAAKYDIRVSTVKKLLKNMFDEGKLKVSSSSSRITVYQPA